MLPKFPNIYLKVEGKPRKKFNQEIDPTEDRTRARCVWRNDVTPRPQRWSYQIARIMYLISEVTELLLTSYTVGYIDLALVFIAIHMFRSEVVFFLHDSFFITVCGAGSDGTMSASGS